MKCRRCKIALENHEAYEYRGAISCAEHFDEVIQSRDVERWEIMEEEESKLEY